ncbi:MAG TPA: flagellar brake protein [Acetivibrio sp.]|nr:flagellar brake protein [Acetivibrio sp.]
MKNLEEYINEEVGLEVINEEGEKIGPSYKTKIVEMLDEDNIGIVAPTFDKYTIPLPVDTKVKIIFKTAYERVNFIIGAIVSKSKSESEILHRVRINIPKPNEITNTSSVRVDCNLKAEYGLVDLSDEKEFKPAKVVSISAKGLSLSVNEEIEPDKSVEVYLWISPKKIISGVCEITQKSETANPKEFKYKLALEFTEICEPDKDAIIKFIFTKQKEDIKANNT